MHRQGTGLADALQERGVTRGFVCGPATDSYALNTRFQNILLDDTVHAVEEMRSLGAAIITLEDIEP